jgi:hypothetical protein
MVRLPSVALIFSLTSLLGSSCLLSCGAHFALLSSSRLGSARPTAFVPRWFERKQKHQMMVKFSARRRRKSVRHTKIATKGVRFEVNSLIFSVKQTYHLFVTRHRITMETGERDMSEDDQKPAALPQHELPEETDNERQEFGILVSST